MDFFWAIHSASEVVFGSIYQGAFFEMVLSHGHFLRSWTFAFVGESNDHFCIKPAVWLLVCQSAVSRLILLQVMNPHKGVTRQVALGEGRPSSWNGVLWPCLCRGTPKNCCGPASFPLKPPRKRGGPSKKTPIRKLPTPDLKKCSRRTSGSPGPKALFLRKGNKFRGSKVPQETLFLGGL